MAEQKKQITVALAGNPNAGKTSLFNHMTGLRAHVANYPGVTVEQKWGTIKHNGYEIKIVDLPGTYSLNPYSVEEKVARDFILNERPDLVIDVVDSTNLERNLYLTIHFLEIGIPTVVALNMMDLAKAQGLTIDPAQLEDFLGVKASPIVATTGLGVEALLDNVVDLYAQKKTWTPIEISYGQHVDEALAKISAALEKDPVNSDLPPRWLALKYLENDPDYIYLIKKEKPVAEEAFSATRSEVAKHLLATVDDEIEGVITDRRYGFLAGLAKQAVRRAKADSRSLSDKIDQVVLNRLAAPFILLAIMYALYSFTFWASGPVVSLLESLFELLGRTAEANMSEGMLKSLVISGIIDGVGGVVGFVPLIAFMFIGISILEDSGYMARAAFILDRLFRAFGLHGNSVVALMVGGGISGGCAIPGIMAARTLRDPRERIATIMVTPFMTCGAKLPVFALLVSAFFGANQGTIMFLITLTAWVLALLAAKLWRTLVLSGAPTPFVMELPPYRLPTIKGLLLHSWERTADYLKRAGTIILAVSIIIWAMLTFPAMPLETQAAYEKGYQSIEEQLARNDLAQDEAGQLQAQLDELVTQEAAERMSYSAAGRIGKFFEPISEPIGFDWKTNVALVGGIAAKEVILSTLGTVNSMAPPAEAEIEEAGDEEGAQIKALALMLRKDPGWTPLTAISLIIFVLIYAPCFPTLVVIKKEIGAKWALYSLFSNTIVAYLLSLIIFQGGRLLGF